jgi:septal ring factor EnvC (AmiA/AmiB activator)
MRQASTILSIVSPHPSVHGLAVASAVQSCHLATPSPCGSDSVKIQQRVLQQALVTVRQYVSQARDLEAHLERLDAKVTAEHDVLQRRLHQTNTDLKRERTRIFDAVRNQFVPSGSYLAGSSVILPPAPSAPVGL